MQAPSMARWWAPLAYGAMLGAHSLLRPMRDAYGIQQGAGRLPLEVVATFAFVTLACVTWSAIASYLPRRQVLRTGLHVLAGSLLLFWGLFAWVGPTSAVTTSFFIGSSSFNVMATSLFWGRLSDLHNEDEGRSGFPQIAAGGTVGAVLGPMTAAALAKHVPPHQLLLAAAALLELAAMLVALIARSMPVAASPERAEPSPPDDAMVGGRWSSGARLAFASHQLRSLSIYVLLAGMLATLIYLEQGRVVAEGLKTLGDRAQFFAMIDLTTNLGTIAIQLFLSAAWTSRLGLVATIALLPIAGGIGAMLLAWRPALTVLFAVQVVRRIIDYSLAGPAREVLFTTLEAEHRYKAKGFVDVVASRFGDALSALLKASGIMTSPHAAWLFAGAALIALRGVYRARSRSQMQLASS